MAGIAGLSTLGVQVGYAVETTKGVCPDTFKKLTRINGIGGITINTNNIDASALEDDTSKFVRGRGDLDSNWTITINLTSETYSEWKALISAYDTGAKDELKMWFAVVHPELNQWFYIIAQPPSEIPFPEMAQNELLTVEISLVVNEYVGLDAKKAFEV